MKYSIHILVGLGQASKTLRVEKDIQNVTEAIKFINWDIPNTSSRINIVDNSGNSDKIVCTINRENIFNQMKAFIIPTPVEFVKAGVKESFVNTAGLNPARTLAEWLVSKIS